MLQWCVVNLSNLRDMDVVVARGKVAIVPPSLFFFEFQPLLTFWESIISQSERNVALEDVPTIAVMGFSAPAKSCPSSLSQSQVALGHGVSSLPGCGVVEKNILSNTVWRGNTSVDFQAISRGDKEGKYHHTRHSCFCRYFFWQFYFERALDYK